MSASAADGPDPCAGYVTHAFCAPTSRQLSLFIQEELTFAPNKQLVVLVSGEKSQRKIVIISAARKVDPDIAVSEDQRIRQQLAFAIRHSKGYMPWVTITVQGLDVLIDSMFWTGALSFPRMFVYSEWMRFYGLASPGAFFIDIGRYFFAQAKKKSLCNALLGAPEPTFIQNIPEFLAGTSFNQATVIVLTTPERFANVQTIFTSELGFTPVRSAAEAKVLLKPWTWLR